MNFKQLVTIVSLKISKLLNRPLTLQETSYIIDSLQEEKESFINTTHTFPMMCRVAVKAATQLASTIKKYNPPKKEKGLYPLDVDMHEYLKTTVLNQSSIPEYNTAIVDQDPDVVSTQVNPINLASLMGFTTRQDIQNVFNPKARYIKNYLILDSRYRNLDTNGTSVFQWIYSDTNNLSVNAVNTSGTIRNLVSMKLYQFVFPDVNLNNDSGRLAIYIQEFKDASFIASGSQSYHWITRVAQGASLPQPSAFYVQCQVEDYQDGILYFNKPITQLNQFTISFSDPLNQISLPYDRSRATIISYGATTTIRTTIDNNLSIGGRVFITGFSTDNPTQDQAVIAAVNNPFGILVSNIVTPTDFVIPVDTSTVTPTTGLIIQVYFAQFRFILSFEVTYLRDD
jgi:hypothetical protein